MTINLSPAQYGAIVHCLQKSGYADYDRDDIDSIIERIKLDIQFYLGPVFYEMWVQEFVQPSVSDKHEDTQV